MIDLKDESGHSTLTVMVIILFASTLFLAVALLFRQNIYEYKTAWKKMSAEMEIERITGEILAELENDPTPDSHSYQDPVWDYISANQTEDIKIALTDISSRLNPNWMRTKLFEETKLKTLIISGEAPDAIRDRRTTEGFTNDLAVWLETFGEENLNRFFTLHSWANINVTYEESLERIYIERYGENGSASFRNNIQDGLRQGKLWTHDELRNVMGMAADDLYPLINTLPQMNVHFMEPLILESLVSYPYREDPIEFSASKYQALIDRKEGSELTRSDLISVISPNENQMRVLEYIGTQTYFWELVIGNSKYEKKHIISFDGETFTIIK